MQKGSKVSPPPEAAGGGLDDTRKDSLLSPPNEALEDKRSLSSGSFYDKIRLSEEKPQSSTAVMQTQEEQKYKRKILISLLLS
jgi:hypothetical protein